jgi:HD-GYP domain-containing protein (c-di-GMP phosphodiesterase class II)
MSLSSVDFDIRTDAVFQDRIKPFIEKELRDLALFDQDREAWAKENLPPDYVMTYRFADHAKRVAEDMRRTALHLGWGEAAAEALYWAMLPHDIGKRFLPVELWDRMDKPDEALKALRRSHVERGAEYVLSLPPPLYDSNDEVKRILNWKFLPEFILSTIFNYFPLPFPWRKSERMYEHEIKNHPFLTLMLDIMLNHHEQMDGKGHRGVKGADLSPPVRLACIVESFDGYATARPHFGDRDISIEGVLNRMRTEKGADVFDMELFEAFAEVKTKS